MTDATESVLIYSSDWNYFFSLSLFFTFSPSDYYGANKIIPNGIEIYKPIENEPIKKEFEKYDLILSPSECLEFTITIQTKKTECGDFYIKVFEITSNDKLSEDRIKIHSKVKVDIFEPKIYSGEFIIYEDSWGINMVEEFNYGLNFQKDYKIAERNYINEGWIR